uniref:PASTA domain-containing protein n=3 Tax=unclassified Prevotella TaxID=2638335 RepID=A0AB33JPD6_9BACT
MKSSEFVNKFKSRYFWGNILAMIIVVAALGFGVKYGLDVYTHHGESITIPNIKHMNATDAEHMLDNLGLTMVVTDTGYVKSLPADCILEQSPESGERVKSGHIVYVTINSLQSPTIALPDVIDNSSLREAIAKLSAMGFKLTEPQYVAGEKDWVYGIIVRGQHVTTGQRISVEDSLTILVGNGQRSADDSIDYIEPSADPIFEEEKGEVDEFQEVTVPEEQPATTPNKE